MDPRTSVPPSYAFDLPAYTPAPEPNQPISCDPGPSTSNPPYQEYEYKNGNLKLNLGRKRDRLFRPAYGWNASVDGYVEVKKNTKGIQSIVVSIEGNVTTGVSERGFLTDLTKTRVLHMSRTLFEASSSQSPAEGGTRYDFSFPLPSYVTGGTQPLPPTFATLHPGVGADVNYFVKVEMIRKGMLRQNERLKAFFFYLPRTYAPSPDSTSAEKLDEHGWHVAPVLPQLPRTVAPASAPDLCVSVAFPRPLEYAATSPIPFYLAVANCSMSGALPLLFSGLSLQLVRVTAVKVGDRQSVREKVIGGGEIFRVEEHGNVRKMFGSVQCRGKLGESSWSAAGIEVKYKIRVSLGPPSDMPSLACTLPTYTHEQAVKLRSQEHSWGREDEREPEFSLAPVACTGSVL